MIYRKEGSVARWENGTLIRVTESGVAREDGDLFECWPEHVDLAVADSSSNRVLEIARSLQHLPLERLVVVHGTARHECNGRTWSDETERIHLSMTHGRLRVLIDSATPRLDDWNAIADALRRAEPNDAGPPPRIVLAPNVTAAILPSLPNVIQTAGGIDGYGNDIVEATGDECPNAYRPSYRAPPIRIPHNIRLEHEVSDIDPDLPRGIALLGPIGEGTVRVLVVDGERVYPATISFTEIKAVGREREWYPYDAGSFGAELML